MKQCIKRLRLEHGRNIRDLGGYETEDGHVTGFGVLLRAGGLQNLTQAEWERLTGYGVRTVIDLRSLAEIKEHPDQVPDGVEWKHCPLQTGQIEPNDPSGSAEKAFAGSLTQGYLNMVLQNGELLANALKYLIRRLPEGTVLFHCAAGKDRTGVLASAIYYLCGISDEDIIADYEVTYTYNKNGLGRLLELLDDETRSRMLPYMTSEPANMAQLLDLYREVDLPEYLKQYVLTEEEIRTLKQYLTN